jgi:hypothetical protein
MNQNQIVNVFNNYFLSIADTIISNNNIHVNTKMTNPVNYLTNNVRRSFTKISWQYNSTYEIEKNIKPLNTETTYGYNKISNRIIKVSAPFTVNIHL